MLCRNCKRLLCRLHLEGDSKVEVKCASCNTMNLITARAIEGILVPDGLGGYLTRGIEQAIKETTE